MTDPGGHDRAGDLQVRVRTVTCWVHEKAGERSTPHTPLSCVNSGACDRRRALSAPDINAVAMDVVPVVFGSGKRYFGSIDGQHLLEDPHVVIQGDRVLHLRFKVRR